MPAYINLLPCDISSEIGSFFRLLKVSYLAVSSLATCLLFSLSAMYQASFPNKRAIAFAIKFSSALKDWVNHSSPSATRFAFRSNLSASSPVSVVGGSLEASPKGCNFKFLVALFHIHVFVQSLKCFVWKNV